MAPTIYTDAITTTQLPDAIRQIYSTELEFTTRPVLIMDQPAFVEPWPEFAAKRGNTVTRTVYHQLAPAIAPLTENQDVGGGDIVDHQISVSIREYGYAIGTTEALDLLSYHGPISSIVKSLLAPQMAETMDTLARNAMWTAPNVSGGVKFRTAANGAAADRWHLSNSQNITADMVKSVAYRLQVRQVPVISDGEPCFVALCHPAVTNDLRSDSYWKDAQLYAGSTRLFNGEEGMLHGVRFVKSVRLRLPNGGKLKAQTTLTTGTYAAGTNTVGITEATGFSVGDEITLHKTGISVTAPDQATDTVTWISPDGTDPIAEHLVISALSASSGAATVTFQTPLLYTHNAGDYCTEAYDVYPISFVGGVQPLAKGVVIPPEVRVSLPTDKLRRMFYLGWYSLMGFGVQRDWAYEILDVTASANTAPVYGSQL